MANLAEAVGADMSLIRAVVAGNEAQKVRTAAKVLRLLTGDSHGMATGKVVAVLGVAFKAETDDIRESPAISIVRELLGAGARVRVHDPKALPAFRAMFGDAVSYFDDEFTCLEGADAATILTEWNEYRNLDLPRAASVMREPESGARRLLLDTRNVLDPDDARSAGFEYHGTGR